jgi:tetratricopeptide (TPR) repeat protein
MLVALRLGGRLLGRPGEALLGALAAADRPGLRQEADRWTGATSAELHIAAGRAAYSAGQHAEALHRFGLALELAPEASWAWHGRGDALQLLGRYEDALAAYSRAAALAPETGLHEAGRANALAALGRGEEAAAARARARP